MQRDYEGFLVISKGERGGRRRTVPELPIVFGLGLHRGHLRRRWRASDLGFALRTEEKKEDAGF